MDEDNFTFQLDGWTVVMSGGELTINDVGYQEDPEDPTYAMARALWRTREERT